MTDLTKTIEPRSDQLNADDLISGPITIKITSVKVNNSDQPVSIHYEGDGGRVWKPCKTSIRTLIAGWKTSDGDKFVGRQVTLRLDSDVTWAGQAVGGIRVSHMSNIESDLKLMLTVSRGKKKPYTIKKLNTVPLKKITDEELKSFESEFSNAKTMDDLKIVGSKISSAGYDSEGTKTLKDMYRTTSAKIREQGQ